MKRYFPIFTVVVCLSCSSAPKSPEIHLQTFKNYALVTEDSCRNWKLPLTSFKIEYPSGFKAQYNYNNNYLTITRKNDSGYVEQEFSLGKLQGIKTPEQVKQWTMRADSMLRNYQTYQSTFAGNENIGNESRFVLKGTINFDGMGNDSFKGTYEMLLSLIPTDKRPNGVSMTYISRYKKDNPARKGFIDSVINTLEFFPY